MPRAGLGTAEVVDAGARLADEVGIEQVTLALLAERLGVRPPALYKHVASIGDLRHRIATLAMTELGDHLQEALQGRSGADAVRALFLGMQAYIRTHPGRYQATTGEPFAGDDDPLLAAATRVITSLRAALSGYGIADDEIDHAIRTLRCTMHGYAELLSRDGFRWANDPGASLDWMIDFVDVGLAGMRSR